MKTTCASMAIMLDKITADDVTTFFPEEKGVNVAILRLDAMHHIISGNKYFKLKHNIEAAIAAGHKQIITFGGAYSNHLIAAAAAINAQGIQSIGIVRGQHASQVFTPTLLVCQEMNMHLHFATREDYNRKNDDDYRQKLIEQYGAAFFIPEGGDNEAGRKGCGDIVAYIPDEYNIICTAIGTGTTFAGIRNNLPASKRMLGFPAVKGGEYLQPLIAKHLPKEHLENWSLINDYHFGGFAKVSDELINFMRRFYVTTAIQLDIVYTGKMLFAIEQMMLNNYFPSGSKILVIHSGGLQGNPANLYT